MTQTQTGTEERHTRRRWLVMEVTWAQAGAPRTAGKQQKLEEARKGPRYKP